MKLRQRKKNRNKKKEAVQKRKAETLLNSNKSKKKKNNKTCTINRLSCNNCEEEMISDVETNDLKNIGCDNCPARYHLKCTEFAGKMKIYMIRNFYAKYAKLMRG